MKVKKAMMCQCRWQNFEKKHLFTGASGHLVKPVPVFFFGTVPVTGVFLYHRLPLANIYKY
jgi:hypothetical protein